MPLPLLLAYKSALNLVAPLLSMNPIGLAAQGAFRLPVHGPLSFSAYILEALSCSSETVPSLSPKYLDSPFSALFSNLPFGIPEVPPLSFHLVIGHWLLC